MKYILKSVLSFITVLFTLLFLTPAAMAQIEKSKLITQPGYYKMEIGEFEVTALSDGTCMLDMSKLLFNAQPGEVERLLKQNNLKTTVETSINAYLIKHGEKLILVDAGCGETMGATLGQLTKSMLNAGYKPEQIDAILITHLHIDHVGGLTSHGKMIFPNATIYISKPEAAFWLDPQSKKNAPESALEFFDPAVIALEPYFKANRVKIFDKETHLFEGITSIPAIGHTPGHIFYLLESKGEKMVFWGDLVHCGAVQFENPAVTVGFDVDAAKAAKARRIAFDDAVKNNYWIAAPHLSFPGIGHLRRVEKTYVWIPANYSLILAEH